MKTSDDNVAKSAQPPNELKPQVLDTLRRELDRAARQLDGLSKSLKRLKESIDITTAS